MLVKSKLLEKKDVHLNKSISRENSPPVQEVRDEDSDGDDCDEQESVKEIGKKKIGFSQMMKPKMLMVIMLILILDELKVTNF